MDSRQKTRVASEQQSHYHGGRQLLAHSQPGHKRSSFWSTHMHRATEREAERERESLCVGTGGAAGVRVVVGVRGLVVQWAAE